MGIENHSFESEQRPSWARANWPPTETDALTAALDPTQMAVEIKAAAKAAGKPLSEGEVERAARNSIRAMLLIRTYRVRGHLAASLDPLGLAKQEIPPDLTPEYHGFVGEDQDAPVYVGRNLGLEWTTVRKLVEISGITNTQRISWSGISEAHQQVATFKTFEYVGGLTPAPTITIRGGSLASLTIVPLDFG